jgi:hypothetical protein
LAAKLREAVQHTRRGRVETYDATIPAAALPALKALAGAQHSVGMRRCIAGRPS